MTPCTTLEWSKTLWGGEHVTFERAEQAVAELGEGWRLPTLQELIAANDYNQYPVVQQEGVERGSHWTSTPCPWARESAVFVVSSHDGYVSYDHRTGNAFVRAVRGVPAEAQTQKQEVCSMCYGSGEIDSYMAPVACPACDPSMQQQGGGELDFAVRLGCPIVDGRAADPDKFGVIAIDAALAQQPAAVDGAIDKARFKRAPCYLCGYNGPGYYQPDTHPCAAKYHAAQQPAAILARLRQSPEFALEKKWLEGYQQGYQNGLSEQSAAVDGTCAAVAAIQFALTDPEGMTFLRLWNEGEFDTLRREWPDAIRKIYVGADPLATTQPAAPVLAKHQPCGCVICTCEDERQCHGCGAKHCGNRADHPSYVVQQPAAEGVQPEARDVVDEGSRSVTRQLLHWDGVPVHVTGTVTTSPGNWALIDALATKHQEPTT